MKSLLVLFINYLNPLPFDMYRYTDINCQITVLFILIIFFICISPFGDCMEAGSGHFEFRLLIFWIRLFWLCKN